MVRVKQVLYRRKKQGKTDYKLRLNLLKSKKPRMVIRKSLKNVGLQVIEYNEDGDRIIVSAHTRELMKKYKWKCNRRNIPAAYLTGFLLGKKALKKNIKEAVCDMGLGKKTKGSVLFSALKGVIDSGLKIPHSKEIFPSDDRIKGKHIKKLQEGEFDKIKESIEKI
jgi:large subunit ribosomal protein L18